MNNGENNLLFYIIFVIVVSVVFGDVLGKFIEIIPYFVAGMASLLPFYGEVKRKSRNNKFHMRVHIKKFITKNSVYVGIVSVVMFFLFREDLSNMVIVTTALSMVSILLIGVLYSFARAIVKASKQLEIPSYFEMWKNLVKQ